MKFGIAGKIAQLFIRSKLTPLIVITALILGVFAVIVTPREEDPQIVVPMIDVFVRYPGASAKEVEERVTKPMEKFLWEIKGVEYIYSTSRPGLSMVTVRYKVGEDMEKSITNLYTKLFSHLDLIPPGVSMPIVKPKSIDDVPVLTLTLWSNEYDGYELRKIALETCDYLKKDKDVAETHIIGGPKREVKVDIDPIKLKSYHISPLQISQMISSANVSLSSGSFPLNNYEFLVETGSFLKDANDVGNVIVGVFNGRPVKLSDVATITDGPEEAKDYVFMGFGPSWKESIPGIERSSIYPAVTITIAKKKGTNATELSDRLLDDISRLKGTVIPSGVEVTTTRNYGNTANEKSNELLEHMLLAAVSVTVLIGLSLGIREALVVAVAIPVTLALTLLATYLFGFTLNRVTLFALIFSIGILVDDAIVVVENIHRHFREKEVSILVAIQAVNEVGNPTILATFTVIAALLPMAFVSGMMGPYMKPIPIGASAAMIISLLIAFIISPWLSYIVLKNVKRTEKEKENRIISSFNKIYRKNLTSMLESGKKRVAFIIFTIICLLASVALLPLKVVMVKMLPFDNKSEIQVLIDTPKGTTLETTNALAEKIAEYIRTVPEVDNYQIYSGTASPITFNGLVRHYFLRKGDDVADIQINLVPKDERSAQSHDIAKRIRGPIDQIASAYNARIKIVEVPPGPPVLSTLVAEVYGPNFNEQLKIASEVEDIFKKTHDVVDVDWLQNEEQTKYIFKVDKEKAAYNGISTYDIAQSLQMALHGTDVGLLHTDHSREPVEIWVQAPLKNRASLDGLQNVALPSSNKHMVSLAELVTLEKTTEDQPIYRKNLRRVVYVIGDVAGREESPIYAILRMNKPISEIKVPGNHPLKLYFTHEPPLGLNYSVKWDGEWQITYEVFRDLGIAFAVVLIIIYVMIVGWFKSYITPFIIMAPIPLSLIGILPAHALLNAFFTATSMIGFIAGAGIVVRNSIILVDFIEMKLNEGVPLKDSIIEGCLVRFRPMFLTAAAVVVGSSVILFDPIFQGMAISLMAGEVAVTIFSWTLLPILYFIYKDTEIKIKEGNIKFDIKKIFKR